MGYGVIIGGGGVKLNYSVVTASSYANLPASPSANTLGFITTTAIPDGGVYFKNGTVSGMSAGDVVVRQSVTSSASFNIYEEGQIYINPSGAYQYSGSAWVPIDAYVYLSSAWVLISAIYYDSGYIPSNVGTFIAYKSGGTTATVTLNADNVQFTVSSASGWAYSQYAIDVTNISTLWFNAYVTNASGMFVGIAPNQTSATGRISSTVTNLSPYMNNSVNVSSATGNYYIVFGLDSSTTRMIYVNKIWGV